MLRKVYWLLPTFRYNQSLPSFKQSAEECYATYIGYYWRFETTNRSHNSNHNSEDITQLIKVITDVFGQPTAPMFQTKSLRDVTQRILLLPTFRDNLSVPSSREQPWSCKG